MKYKIFFYIVLLSNYSCDHHTNTTTNGKINRITNVFSSKKFGWTMPIPDNWEIVHKEELDNQVERGLKNISQANSTELQEQLKSIYLLSFKKNERKSFTAIAEPFDTLSVTFEQQNKNSKEVLYNALKQQGIQMDTIWGTELIHSKKFTTFEIVVYDKSNQAFFHQVYYNRQIDNYMFSVIIGYDSKEIKDIIMENWRKSTFEK